MSYGALRETDPEPSNCRAIPRLAPCQQRASAETIRRQNGHRLLQQCCCRSLSAPTYVDRTAAIPDRDALHERQPHSKESAGTDYLVWSMRRAAGVRRSNIRVESAPRNWPAPCPRRALRIAQEHIRGQCRDLSYSRMGHTPVSVSGIATDCWRAGKSHPIIRIRPPSFRALRGEHRKSTRLVVRPTSL